MGDQRGGGIVWTEQTWNPLRGCSRVSAGCMNCYAESMAARFCGAGQPYEGTINPETKRWNGVVRLVPEKLIEPLRWQRPRMVFVNSMSDLFHEDVPDGFLDEIFDVMARAPQHTFQVLTKRAHRMHSYLNYPYALPHILPNVWLGVTVENQQAADERIPLLLQTPAAVRWVSVEPMIGPVDLGKSCWKSWTPNRSTHIDWVVCGGESGHNARPIHPDWVCGLRDQCREAGVPFLFKQWGEWVPMMGHSNGVPVRGPKFIHSDGTIMGRAGKKAAGRLLDGVQHDNYPRVIQHDAI